jgi:3-deoxy-D-manno-octulosonic-acid transferase
VAFIGGSLGPAGGHTPFEAAALGAAVLHGPHTAKLGPAYAALDAAGGAKSVSDAEELAGAVVALLNSEPARREMAEAARAVQARLAPDVAALAAEVLDMTGMSDLTASPA